MELIRFDVILQHNLPIEQWLLHIRDSFGLKTKSPCFDHIHPLADKGNNRVRSLTGAIFLGHTKIALTNRITENTWFLSLGISNVRRSRALIAIITCRCCPLLSCRKAKSHTVLRPDL